MFSRKHTGHLVQYLGKVELRTDPGKINYRFGLAVLLIVVGRTLVTDWVTAILALRNSRWEPHSTGELLLWPISFFVVCVLIVAVFEYMSDRPSQPPFKGKASTR